MAILVVSLGLPCLAKNPHAPLRPQILAAKTVYVENHGSARLKDKAYDELRKWGRWEIVEDRSKADLVIALSSEDGQSSTGRTQTYDPNMKTGDMKTGGWKYGTVTSTTPGSVHLELLDIKSGESLYADTRSTAHGIIKELQKRMEEPSKPKKN